VSESLSYLLWQAVSNGYGISSHELECIDNELAARLRKEFPDEVVNTNKISSTLLYHLSLRNKIARGRYSAGSTARDLGFVLARDFKSRQVHAKREKTLRKRILSELKKRKITPDNPARKKDIIALNNSTLAHRIRRYGRIVNGKDSISSGLKALGFTTVSAPRPALTEAQLREDITEKLHKYRLFNNDVVRKKDILCTKDNSLAKKLRNLGKLVSDKDSISAGLKALGYETNGRCRQSLAGVHEKLLEIWPYEQVKKAYDAHDPSIILSLEKLSEKYPELLREMRTIAARSEKDSVEKMINSVHDDFPHLYSFVSRFVTSVDEENLGKRLRAYFFNDGVNIAPTALKKSRNPGHRKLYRQVTRAGIGPLGIRIETPCQTIERLTSLRKKDFSCSVFQNSKLLSEITEKATKLVLLVTNLVDPTGAYFRNGFRKFFPEIRDVNPITGRGLRIYRWDGSYVEPDAMASSARKNFAVETKAGTTVNAASNLFENYDDLSAFRQDNAFALDGVIAVIQMNRSVYDRLADPLGEIGIKAVPPEKFLEYLSKAVAELECSPCHTYVAEAVPRVHSLANIYRFHEIVVNSPHIALKPANRKLALHHNQVLGGLVESLERASENTKILNTVQ